ncbi:transmembrane protein 158 [Rhincodon typus]|uniref:transmembrane protein 158 n=1 Tax=Rhincodon typus TaxID=259920 RepID=UPI0009A2FF34|nr:transmembrane protein 158 [Rhincodon typus]
MLTSQFLSLVLLASTGLPGLLGWSGEEFYFQPNSTALNFSLAAPLELEGPGAVAGPGAGAPALSPPSNRCNITVLRLVATSLLARWERSMGFKCDVLLFTTNSNARSFFSAAFTRVFPPVIIDHVGVGGGQQEFKLCVGCGGPPRRGRLSPTPQGQQVSFCCLHFSLEELSWDKGWRINRKPIESTLVACFMTIVIIIWSVAALIWPVPIIAGFLPNGMEQRRG